MAYSTEFVLVLRVSYLLIPILVYFATIAVRRLYFHPLSRFAGPQLAALTTWYEGYHEAVLGGTYIKRYADWHRTYGPIIRIGPNHLHINEPSFYHITSASYLKEPEFYDRLGVSKSLAAIVDPHKHRSHRNVLNPIFSKHNVAKKYPLVAGKVQRALDFIRRRSDTSTPFDVELLFRRVTMDVVSKTLFGYSFDLIESDDEYPPQLRMLADFVQDSGVIKHFPVLKSLSKALPDFMNRLALEGYKYFQVQCEDRIATIVEEHKHGIFNTDPYRMTVFDVLLEENPDKGFATPTKDELIDEAHLFLVAGTGSTSYTLACGMYYLLTHKSITDCLVAELQEVRSDMEEFPFDWKTLSKLPYLGAVVREILRLSTAIPGNLPRVVPSPGVSVCGQFIPSGTSVSVTHHSIHQDPRLFEQPTEFRPERWLGENRKHSERWHVSFSRGSRRCIGMNLAYMEIYTLIANLFSNFAFELYETDEKSMEWVDKGIATHYATVKVRAQPLAHV